MKRAATYAEAKAKLTVKKIIREHKAAAQFHMSIEMQMRRNPKGQADFMARFEAEEAKALQHAEMIKASYLSKGATAEEAEERALLYISRNTKTAEQKKALLTEYLTKF